LLKTFKALAIFQLGSPGGGVALWSSRPSPEEKIPGSNPARV
jgi:hypothetical protein